MAILGPIFWGLGPAVGGFKNYHLGSVGTALHPQPAADICSWSYRTAQQSPQIALIFWRFGTLPAVCMCCFAYAQLASRAVFGLEFQLLGRPRMPVQQSHSIHLNRGYNTYELIIGTPFAQWKLPINQQQFYAHLGVVGFIINPSWDRRPSTQASLEILSGGLT